jgi:hypothetical protein
MTNAELIRSMSDEVLAEYIALIISNFQNGVSFSINPVEWLEWLTTEAIEVHGTNSRALRNSG